MPAEKLSLTDKSVEVILAYASTGLGHLRVTNALFEAAPKGVYPHLLRTSDPTASNLHRLTSLHPLTRAFLEWSQNGLPESFFTRSYRFLLRRGYQKVERELTTLIEQEFNIVKTVVVIATHFVLAHELAATKEKLEKKLGVKILLFVCVTDDSPQKLWYVEGADCLFVPSVETKTSLHKYGDKNNLKPLKIEVLPYPLNPHLAVPLTKKEWREREEQNNPASGKRIQVIVPVSGAAVNLAYTEDLMTSLVKRNPRFHFYVVSRVSMYTSMFINKIGRRPYISLITSSHDREIVKYYNDLVSSTVFSFEITKPSEQGFKALFTPHQKGGITLLFAPPIGRQEHDNLNFLRRHGLMEKRAFQLSGNPKVAAEFIARKLEDRTFLNTLAEKPQKETDETATNGAEQFWANVSALLK